MPPLSSALRQAYRERHLVFRGSSHRTLEKAGEQLHDVEGGQFLRRQP
jgi:hypothetical protein